MATKSGSADRPKSQRPAASPLGERVRALRRSAGLTQAELGGPRFSKEYVSQVELGKTRPSAAALDWFGERLGADLAAVASAAVGAASPAREAAVARAEAEVESQRYAEALAGLEAAPGVDPRKGRLAVRERLARGWALHHLGRLSDALVVLDEARILAAAEDDGDALAVALFRLGLVRYKMGSLTTSSALLDEALAASEATGRPSDALRARIFNVRAKVRRRQKDFTAAAEDVEQALELARSLNDIRVLAETYLDASMVADRRHEYGLAREYAERSRALFEQVNDQDAVGKLLNNLGHLRNCVGRYEEAVPLLRESFRIAVEQDNRVDAAFAASTLASAWLHSGDPKAAVDSARRALELLADRSEYGQEAGNALLVMGRAQLALDRLEEAERSFRDAAERFRAVESVSHLAGAWVALGDVASRRGDAPVAAGLYRQAAEALQDIRW